MASSGIKSTSTVKTIIQQLNSDLKDMNTRLKTLSEQINEMMKGDADGPYWNGKKAKNFYTKAKKNLDNNIADYQYAYTTLSKLAVKYEQAVKADSN